MRLAFQIALGLLIGLGTLYAGVMNMLAPEQVVAQYYGVSLDALGPELRLAVEAQVRLLAGMWIAAGLVLFCSLRRFERHARVIGLVLLGLALGAAGEALAISLFGGDVAAALRKSGGSIVLCLLMALWLGWMLRKSKTAAV